MIPKARIKNIYGKERFSPESAKGHVDLLTNSFKNHFLKLGYVEELPLPISSGFDPSVVFIGSGISVLKPRLFAGPLLSPGYFIVQNCVRARNINGLLDDNCSSIWGSYFTNILLIAPPERLQEAVNETFDYFEHGLKIDSTNMLIRINSADTDLMDICKQRYGIKNLEINTQKPNYYKHKIGVMGVVGRSFNLALRHSGSNNFFDIGNFIIHTYKNRKFFVEIGFGVSTILKELYNLDHVQDCTPVIGIHIKNEIIKRKLEDTIIICVVLFREGLRPFTRDNRNRILKQYLRAMSYLRAKSGLNIKDLSQIISNFERREFPKSSIHITDDIIDSLRIVENDLLFKKILSENEKKIKESLELLT